MDWHVFIRPLRKLGWTEPHLPYREVVCLLRSTRTSAVTLYFVLVQCSCHYTFAYQPQVPVPLMWRRYCLPVQFLLHSHTTALSKIFHVYIMHLHQYFTGSLIQFISFLCSSASSSKFSSTFSLIRGGGMWCDVSLKTSFGLCYIRGKKLMICVMRNYLWQKHQTESGHNAQSLGKRITSGGMILRRSDHICLKLIGLIGVVSPEHLVNVYVCVCVWTDHQC